MYEILKSINSPQDIKKLSINELKELASEAREAILYRLSCKGGHFGPNLGIVEATIALHYVFNSPVDKFVFDVSHQSYCHKLLTGRVNAFINEEDFGNASGYTNPEESEHDIFNVGHTSTSVSLACGLAKARDLKCTEENIVAIIGDGSLSGGEALEGIDFASELGSNLIIVVNDNDMSIAENHGGLYANLKALRDSKGTCECNLFKAFNLDYIYVDEGNDIQTLIDAFSSVKDTKRPVVVHINTVKGKGYEMAEIEKEKYHFFGPFDRKTGESKAPSSESYITVARDYIVKKIESDPLFVAICAGAPSSIGFDSDLRIKAGAQFVDVGIAEEHAVALASAIATNGAKSLFGTYSSFIQRTYDQMSQDLCLNNSPAVILVSNASVFGMRDKTHIGIFDIPLLSSIPNLVYLAPASSEELTSMLNWAVEQNKHPVAIKMPGGPVCSADYPVDTDFSNINMYQITKTGRDVAILALGCFYQIGVDLYNDLKEKGINATLINPRFITGIDANTLNMLKENHHTFVTIEDGVLEGGFGQKIASFLGSSDAKVYSYGLKREFIDRYETSDILYANRLTSEQIIEDIL